MTELRPLTGYVVAPEAADEVVAPPYDALTPEERAAHVQEHPDSFLAVLPEAEYTHDPEFSHARARLSTLISEGRFRPHREFVAVYRLTEGEHRQTGLVADLPVDELRAGRVHPHEHTRPERVAEIVRFLDQVGVASSPVSLAFPDGERLRGELAAVVEDSAPHVEVHERGVHQELWLVEPPDRLLAAARHLDELYITDGHHRTAAALQYADGPGRRRSDAQALLVVLFAADELRLVDYHRIVERPSMPAPAVAETLAAAGWDVTEVPRPAEPPSRGEVLVVSDRGHYRLRMPWADGIQDPVAGLDVTRFHTTVLQEVLGVDDPRQDPGIRFVPGDHGVARLRDEVSGTDAIGFALHPPGMDDMIAVADAGQVMPPKSTYFTPKVRSGLVLRFRH